MKAFGSVKADLDAINRPVPRDNDHNDPPRNRLCREAGQTLLCAQGAGRTRRLPRHKNDQLKVGSFTRSSLGTDSNGSPALRQAASPPTITNVLNPLSRSMCATRALVASRGQVQYK